MIDSNNKKMILFLSANPEELEELALIKEANTIADKIKYAKNAYQFDFRQRYEVSVSSIQYFLSDHSPQVLHFSGHGEKGFLLLQDSYGSTEKAKTKALANMFKTLNGRSSINEREKIRCVVLSACFSRSIAKAVAKYVDCVIGMSNEIREDAGIAFAETFYYYVCSGESIKDAFEFGRNQVALLAIPGQDIPKLEVRNGIDPSKIFLIHDVPTFNQIEPTKMVGDLLEKYAKFSISTKPTVDEFWETEIKGGLGTVLLFFSSHAKELGLDSSDKNEIDTILAIVPPKLRSLIETLKYSTGTPQERQEAESEIRRLYAVAIEIFTKFHGRSK